MYYHLTFSGTRRRHPFGKVLPLERDGLFQVVISPEQRPIPHQSINPMLQYSMAPENQIIGFK